MKILLLGVGMQGQAALYDLARSPQVSHIIAADQNLDALRLRVARDQHSARVRVEPLDAASPDSLDRLMRLGPDVVIDLLPVSFIGRVAEACVRHGIHLVNTFYVVPDLAALADQALARGLTILPEFGLDPGLDLVLLGHAVRSLDQVDEIWGYGAGIPEPEAAQNPLKYKITWTFDGVLRSYWRAGRIVRNGKVVAIGENQMFRPEHIHRVDVEGVGTLEAIPNGDALRYAEPLGLDPTQLRNLGRYSMRWPGHCALWQSLVDLHLLDDEPALVDGVAVDRKRFLAAAMGPHLQYADHERDVVIVRIEVKGWQAGIRRHLIYQIIDRRDLGTGLTAMSRTVGFTASIGAQLIGSGAVSGRGMLSPVTDVPFDRLAAELRARGIHVTVAEGPQVGDLDRSAGEHEPVEG